jgi:hypothetical protein
MTQVTKGRGKNNIAARGGIISRERGVEARRSHQVPQWIARENCLARRARQSTSRMV